MGLEAPFCFGLNSSTTICVTTSNEDCRSVRAKVHEVSKIAASLLLMRTVQSSKCRRLEAGCFGVGYFSILPFEMLPTGI